jgi:hypothetical protein
MSDQLPNLYSAYPDNFSQGSPAQQAQQRSPQQPQQVGSQPPQAGISNGQVQYRYQQQQQQQQQAQQSGGEPAHGGVATLSVQQQQVCLAPS